MSSAISVVFALDANYAVHTGVAMLSILQRARQPERFCFHLLTGNQPLPEEVQRQYQTLVNAHGARLRWLHVDSTYLDTLRRGKDNHSGITTATHYRICIADLLPDLDRCIYLDGDLLAMDDLALLWDGTEVDGFSLAAVHYPAPPARVLALHPHLRGYFNAGVLLINLRYWREHDLTQKYLDYTRNPDNLQYHTNQDTLNAVCANSAKILHPRWNDEHELRGENTAPPGIVHFTGGKPWNYRMRHRHSMEYWRVRSQSPWWNPAEARTIWRRACIGRWKAKCSNLCRVSFSPKKGKYRIVLFGRCLLDVDRSRQRAASGS